MNKHTAGSIKMRQFFCLTAVLLFAILLTFSTSQLHAQVLDEAPESSASPASGIFNTGQMVTLNAVDVIDLSPTIYYTTDGSEPSTSSTEYTDPIAITSDTTLKFFAVDASENEENVNTEKYVIDEFLIFVDQFGTGDDDHAYAVATDGTGAYVTGDTDGVLNSEDGNQGGNDFYVRMYDLDGEEGWTRQFGTSDDDFANGIAIDSTGVYVAGYTYGEFYEDGSAGGTDAFVSKYDLDGNEVWTRQFGTSDDDFANGIAIDSTGVYVAGYTYGDLAGPIEGEETSDAFVRMYDLDGEEGWTRQFGTSYYDFANGIAIDSTGVYVAGYTYGEFYEDGSAGGTDAFVSKYDLDGNEVWTRQFGTSDDDFANGIAIDSTGVYVAGYTYGDLAGDNQGGADAFVSKYDLDGNEVWTRQFGTSDDDFANSIAVDSTGIFVAGDVGVDTCGECVTDDPVIRKLSLDGAILWTRQYDTDRGDESTNAYGVAVDASGLYVAGTTNGVVEGENEGGDDAFIMKLGLDRPDDCDMSGSFTAIRANCGFNSNTLARNDDGSTELVPIGFDTNFFGDIFSNLYVNNNGDITFDSELAEWTPFDLTTTGRKIIAPYFSDVDTRDEGSPVKYGTDTVDGHPAFGVNWIDVSCFNAFSSTPEGLNRFQLVLIDRSDIDSGDFDIEFNYDQILWETGQASGGTIECLGGSSARAGFSQGTGLPGTFFELPGSGVNGAFLDDGPEETSLIQNSRNSDVLGRYIFEVRNGITDVPSDTETLTLNAVQDLATGATFTVSGRLTDGASGEELEGETITIDGTGIPDEDVSVTTQGIEFVDSGGLDIVYCADCASDVADDGTELGSSNNVLHLDIGGMITFPSGSVVEAKLAIQDMGDDLFTLRVTEDNVAETTFDVESGGSSEYVPLVDIVSPNGIKKIEILTADNGFVGIANLRTFASDPELFHYITFEDPIVPGTYPSPLTLDGGSFFFIGIAQSTPAQGLTVQAHHDTTDSNVQTYNVLEASWGAAGEPTSTTPDSGTGITTLDCSATDPDTDGDGLCNSWESATATVGIPYKNGAGVAKVYNLCYVDAVTGLNVCPNPNSKDLFVELDYMQYHLPDPAAITKVKAAFAAKGITLHVITDEQLTHVDALDVWKDPTADANDDDDFYNIKRGHFGKLAEHPVTFGGTQTNGVTTASGTAKTATATGITLTTTGASSGTMFIKQTVTLGAAATITGTPTVTKSGSVGAGLTLGTPTVSVTPTTSSTVKTITITQPFSTTGAASAASIGTLSTSFTLGTAQTASIASAANSPSSDISALPTNPRLQAKAMAYHYGMFIHSIGACGPSGIAEVNGNDFIVALGCDFDVVIPGHTGSIGSIDEQAGTFMHELGHNLNLDHGGPRQLLTTAGTGVSLGGTQTNSQTSPPALGTAGTAKSIQASGVTITTQGAATGDIIIRQTVTFGASTTASAGTPTKSGTGAGLTLATIKASISPGPAFAATTHTLTLTIPYTASGALNGIALGSIITPLTLGTSTTTSSIATTAGSPILRVGISSVDYLMNCKPNQLSVMTYAGQFPFYIGDEWVPDYNGQALATLSEASLLESSGLTGTGSPAIVFGTPAAADDQQLAHLNDVGGIDWDGDGSIENVAQSTDINNLTIKGCGLANDGVTSNTVTNEVLKSYDEWSNLKFNFRTGAQSIDGRTADPHKVFELTAETKDDVIANIEEAGTVGVLIDSIVCADFCNGFPRAGFDDITASGSSANALNSDTVTIDWDDGTTSDGIPVDDVTGEWTSPTHQYALADLGPKNVQAILKDEFDAVRATSTIIPIVVVENGATGLKNLSGSDSTSGPAQLAYAGNNVVYAVWSDPGGEEDDETGFTSLAGPGAPDVILRKSTDGGATFGDAINVSNTAATSLRPDVAALPDTDTVFVVWQEQKSSGKFDIFMKKSTNGGTSFGSAINVSNNADDSIRPDIAVSGNTVYVAWADSTSTPQGKFDIFLKKSTNGGSGFGSKINLSNNAGNSVTPVIALNGASKIAVVWTDDTGNSASKREIFLKKSTNGASSFGSIVNISNDAADSASPSVFRSGDTIYVSWSGKNSNGKYDIFLKKSTNGGNSFGAKVNISNNSKDSKASTVVASGASVFVAWIDVTGLPTSNNDVFIKKSTNGGSGFGSALNISENSGDSRRPQISFGDGMIFITWRDNTPGNWDIFFTARQPIAIP